MVRTSGALTRKSFRSDRAGTSRRIRIGSSPGCTWTSPDGDVVAPHEATDPKGTSDLLYVLGLVIRSYAEQLNGVDFRAFYREAQSGATRMIEALKTSDPQTIAEAWEATLRRPPE